MELRTIDYIYVKIKNEIFSIMNNEEMSPSLMDYVLSKVLLDVQNIHMSNAIAESHNTENAINEVENE